MSYLGDFKSSGGIFATDADGKIHKVSFLISIQNIALMI